MTYPSTPNGIRPYVADLLEGKIAFAIKYDFMRPSWLFCINAILTYLFRNKRTVRRCTNFEIPSVCECDKLK